MPQKSPPGGASQKSGSDASPKPRKRGPRYVELRQPKDVLSYVQKLINELRKDGSDTTELGKVSQLLNTWIMAYRAQMETNDFKKLREELDAWKAKQQEQ